jgi:hypothetical protein
LPKGFSPAKLNGVPDEGVSSAPLKGLGAGASASLGLGAPKMEVDPSVEPNSDLGGAGPALGGFPVVGAEDEKLKGDGFAAADALEAGAALAPKVKAEAGTDGGAAAGAAGLPNPANAAGGAGMAGGLGAVAGAADELADGVLLLASNSFWMPARNSAYLSRNEPRSCEQSASTALRMLASTLSFSPRRER